MFEFKISKKSKSSKARIGELITSHGEIKTPVFMPVGTVGAVKTMRPDELESIGAQIILGNTYHLYLRPGDKFIKKAGGLHNFEKWNKPMLTDSGGFQVFSLGEKALADKKLNNLKPAKISDRGVKFFSHLDGSEHFFTPEKSIQIQENLGADVIMAFDECPPATATEQEVEKAVERTHKWLDQCIRVKKRKDQALAPICQGGMFKHLRQKSAQYINSKNMPINAIGGVSVGESKENIYKVTDWCTDILDENKPRYLMGIGYPEDIAKVITLGIDMFDCVLPTRLARHGVVWVRSSNRGAIELENLKVGYEQIDITKGNQSKKLEPISTDCNCATCSRGYSKAYIAHLIKEKEPLGIHLLTIHNLKFVIDLVEEIKSTI